MKLTPLFARNACAEAVEWADGFPTLADAWRACRRGDWMLWLLGRAHGVDDGELRRTTAECVRAIWPEVDAYESARRLLDDAEFVEVDVGATHRREWWIAAGVVSARAEELYTWVTFASQTVHGIETEGDMDRAAAIVFRRFPTLPRLEA